MISFWKNILQKKVQVRLCLNYRLINIQICGAKSHGPLVHSFPNCVQVPPLFSVQPGRSVVGGGSVVRVGPH